MPSFDNAAVNFLGLSQLRGVGYAKLRHLGGIDSIAEQMAGNEEEFFAKILNSGSPPNNIAGQVRENGERLAESLRAAGVQVIRLGDPLYPATFLQLPPALKPLWFFFRGEAEILSKPSVAIVGTRSPSANGALLAGYAVCSLSSYSAPIISGLARGIDELAHEWALACKLPTVSVLGTGILKNYPASNASLAERIIESGGLLISEYLPEDGPVASNFVWRNRLQAALSSCVVAPEWKASSGTAHTIRFATSFGKPTVNLLLEGMEPALDRGRAEHEIVVPREHERFLSIVEASLRQKTGEVVRQGSLFSDTPVSP